MGSQGGLEEPGLDLVVAGGLVHLPGGAALADVGVRDGLVAAIAAPGSLAAPDTVDARGRWVLPGIVDIHVHLRDPGSPHKEDVASGTAAAALGGVTLVGDMPNTSPPLLTAAQFAERVEAAAAKAHVDFVQWAGATRPEEFAGFAALGAAGVKVFLADGSQGEQYHAELAVAADGHLWDILAEAARVGLPVAVHLATPSVEARIRRDWRGRPLAEVADRIVAESRVDKVLAAQRVLTLAAESGARVHLVHVSAAALPLALRARQEGVAVTLETFPPFMSTELIGQLGVLGFDRYRRPEEVEALWAGVRDGDIDCIATDHAPHTLEEKRRGDVDVMACLSGYPELETVLPMVLAEVVAGRLPVKAVERAMARRPAEIVGLGDRKGVIGIGRDADLTLVDPAGRWTIRDEDLRTRTGWSPFSGRVVLERPRDVLLRGRRIVADGELLARPGDGRYLARGAGPIDDGTRRQ